MKRLLILILLAFPALAQAPREIFPSDYRPQPCAEDVCRSFPRAQLAQFGAVHRKLQLEQNWIDAHWDEMTTAFRPICAKIANCLSVPGNNWLFCSDFLRWEFIATADRYPAGSKDYEQWQGSALMFYIGLKNAIGTAEPKSQACARAQTRPGERTLEVWTKPATIGPDYDGFLTVYAIDAETRIPVKAHITIEGQTLLPANDSPDGRAMSFYRFRWPLTLNHVPNADGHRDVVVPNAILTAEGYPVTTLPIPYETPKVIVEMQPRAAKLERGTNTVTVTARDAATGQPVEMRVMAGTRVLGNTNKPLTLEITGKRPEIWATSLFHRYGDVVVAKGE